LSPARRQQIRNPLQHQLGLEEHFVVPKAQHLVSLFSQKLTACFVLFRFGGVLPSVKLDYQAMFETAEIGNERANRTLTPELRAGQLSRTQARPKKQLRFRLFPPQPSRVLAWCVGLSTEATLYQYRRIPRFPPRRTKIRRARDCARNVRFSMSRSRCSDR
jgi:hypothetical protein